VLADHAPAAGHVLDGNVTVGHGLADHVLGGHGTDGHGPDGHGLIAGHSLFTRDRGAGNRADAD